MPWSVRVLVLAPCTKMMRTHMLAAVTSALRECRISTKYAFPGLNTNETYRTSQKFIWSPIHGERTPTPFRNRQKKLRIIMAVLSSQYCVITPEPMIDSGAKTIPPKVVALRRSSGHHTPPRRLRHETTIWSESLPAEVEPTNV